MILFNPSQPANEVRQLVKPSPPLPPRVLARKVEAAPWLGVSVRTLDALIADGLPLLRPSPGIVLMIDLRAALRWLRARAGGGAR
jgi:hypothetical protein